jgi:hypothetical protein
MRRREFIGRLSFAAIVGIWPLAARGEQPDHMRRIGVLMSLAESDPEGQSYLEAFQKHARNLGWVEGANLRIEYRRTGGSPTRRTRLRKSWWA